MSTPEYKIVDVPALLLTVDPRVQRVLDASRVRKLAADWDPRMVGVLTVSHRHHEDTDSSFGSDEYVVLDGQTRFEAFKAAAAASEDLGDTLLCQVYDGLTLAEEAQIFLKHNARKAVHPRDQFRLSVMAGEDWAVDIHNIAAEYGWYAQGMPVPKSGFHLYSAISAVEKIYRLDGGRALRATFDVIGEAFDHKAGTVCSETLYGIGLLFGEHPEGLDVRGLKTKLNRLGFNRYLNRISDLRRAHPDMSMRSASVESVIELYNKGRRTRRV